MATRKSRTFLGLATCAAIAAAAGSLGFAGGRQSAQPDAGQPEMQLPPGWTAEDMQACMIAGTPGEEHQLLHDKFVGNWTGSAKMWMAPGMDPMTTETTWTSESVMDGRFVKTEISGEMPGMGAFNGFGFAGYDNMREQFVSAWIDNHNTGIMRGVGKLSGGGDTLTWTYEYICPINKKPTTMREVYHFSSSNSMSIEMYCNDPKSGEEYKCMQFDMNKRG